MCELKQHMKKVITGITAFLILTGCTKEKLSDRLLPEPDKNEHLIAENALKINKEKNTHPRKIFRLLKAINGLKKNPGSFGYFIENFKLKPYGSQIVKYDGTPISTQHLHQAVFDIDTGNKDLQQCADAVIRMRAEYLYKEKKFNEIKFHFTSGDLLSWRRL